MSHTPLPLADGPVGAVLIPVKAFDKAKVRLSDALAESSRADLAKQMATHVVQAQHDVLVTVCCDDEDVAAWATGLGAHPIWCPGTDLNGAVDQGFRELRDAGYQWVAIAHGDLPLATSLDRLMGWPGVTVVPDRHRSGTNVMVVPTTINFVFSYGTGSLRLHVQEAIRHQRGLRVVHDAQLGWDVDHPADLDAPGTDLRSNLRVESS